MPHDLDWNKHMNNAKYINTAALARTAFIIGNNLVKYGTMLRKPAFL